MQGTRETLLGMFGATEPGKVGPGELLYDESDYLEAYDPEWRPVVRPWIRDVLALYRNLPARRATSNSQVQAIWETIEYCSVRAAADFWVLFAHAWGPARLAVPTSVKPYSFSWTQSLLRFVSREVRWRWDEARLEQYLTEHFEGSETRGFSQLEELHQRWLRGQLLAFFQRPKLWKGLPHEFYEAAKFYDSQMKLFDAMAVVLEAEKRVNAVAWRLLLNSSLQFSVRDKLLRAKDIFGVMRDAHAFLKSADHAEYGASGGAEAPFFAMSGSFLAVGLAFVLFRALLTERIAGLILGLSEEASATDLRYSDGRWTIENLGKWPESVRVELPFLLDYMSSPPPFVSLFAAYPSGFGGV